MIEVKILADSVNPSGNRITSWLLKYPRFIHSEFMTHRVFSRNAASSRAIPLGKMIDAILKEPALPERLGAEQKGMQSGEVVGRPDAVLDLWDGLKDHACAVAAMLSTQYGLHKSLCNRVIEPWAHITVLATATDHRNFFALRAHPDAMPEFQVLAYRMLAQYLKSKPAEKSWSEWHYPVFGEMDFSGQNIPQTDMLKIATARCARLSYLTQDGEHDPAKDIAMHDRLLAAGHLSPFEHCAQAVDNDPEEPEDLLSYKTSNFDVNCISGWHQYRKQFHEENRTCVDYAAILASKPEWVEL